jgi:hypothetical protein
MSQENSLYNYLKEICLFVCLFVLQNQITEGQNMASLGVGARRVREDVGNRVQEGEYGTNTM